MMGMRQSNNEEGTGSVTEKYSETQLAEEFITTFAQLQKLADGNFEIRRQLANLVVHYYDGTPKKTTGDKMDETVFKRVVDNVFVRLALDGQGHLTFMFRKIVSASGESPFISGLYPQKFTDSEVLDRYPINIDVTEPCGSGINFSSNRNNNPFIKGMEGGKLATLKRQFDIHEFTIVVPDNPKDKPVVPGDKIRVDASNAPLQCSGLTEIHECIEVFSIINDEFLRRSVICRALEAGTMTQEMALAMLGIDPSNLNASSVSELLQLESDEFRQIGFEAILKNPDLSEDILFFSRQRLDSFYGWILHRYWTLNKKSFDGNQALNQLVFNLLKASWDKFGMNDEQYSVPLEIICRLEDGTLDKKQVQDEIIFALFQHDRYGYRALRLFWNHLTERYPQMCVHILLEYTKVYTQFWDHTSDDCNARFKEAIDIIDKHPELQTAERLNSHRSEIARFVSIWKDNTPAWLMDMIKGQFGPSPENNITRSVRPQSTFKGFIQEPNYCTLKVVATHTFMVVEIEDPITGQCGTFRNGEFFAKKQVA